MGQYERAVPVLEKAAELSSSDPVIMEHLGDAFRMTGQFKKALEAYRKALSAIEGDKGVITGKIKDLERRTHEK
jgi:Flp pilus assembly protein TadD